jgi:hypothetical protein
MKTVDRLIYSRDPFIEVVPFAQVTPRNHFGVKEFSGEVYDRLGNICNLSLRPSAIQGGYIPRPDNGPLGWPRPRRYLRGRVLYLGNIFEMFGHDLLEPTSCMWPLILPGMAKNIDGVLFHKWRPQSSETQAKFCEPTQTILRMLGISLGQVNIIGDEVMEVEELVVPEQLFKIANCCLEKFIDVVDFIGDGVRTNPSGSWPRRIYFSRSRLGGTPRFPHERLVEKIMADLGYVILHPQDFSFQNQIRLMQRAKCVAGMDGSAMHLAVFCEPGTKVICLDTRYVRTQFILEKLRGLHALHIDMGPYRNSPDHLKQALNSAHSEYKQESLAPCLA